MYLHGRDQNQDNQEPDVGKDREYHGDAEHRIGLNPPCFPVRNDDNTGDEIFV